MIADASQSRTDFKTALALLIVIVVALSGRLCYLVEQFDGDSATFIYLGRVTAEGGVVGREVIDNKLPTVGFAMALPYRVFGLSWPAYVVSGACFSLGGALVLARSAGKFLGEQSQLPTLLFSLVAFNFTAAVYAGFQLETPQMFFSILAAAGAMRALSGNRVDGALLVGLSAGVAASFKPSGAAVCIAFCFSLVITFRSRSCRATIQLFAAALIGATLVSGLMFIALLHRGAIDSTVDLLKQIDRYALNSVRDPAGDAMKLLVVAVLLGFPIFVRGWIFRRVRSENQSIQLPLKWFVFSWFLFESIGVIVQGRMYAYHFLVLAAPAALVFAMLPRREPRLATVAALAPLMALSLWGCAKVLLQARHDRWPARLAISDYLAARTTSDDAVWIDDAPRVWLETDCRAGSSVPSTFLFANDDKAATVFSSRMIFDFERSKPKYIILPTDRERAVREQMQSVLEFSEIPARRHGAEAAWGRLFAYVDRGYVEESRVGAATVFRRAPLSSREREVPFPSSP